MAGHTTSNTEILIRSEVWSTEIKEVLQDTLEAQRYVRWMTEFPDGDLFTIPSIGEMTAQDYQEDTPIEYTAMDTGEFQFQITEYVSAATYITKKQRQDSFYSAELEGKFVPSMNRAIFKDLELHILKEGQPRTGNPAGYQVPGNLNLINGQAHRWVGSGTVGTNPVLAVEDFARANLSLTKAHVPAQNRIAIIDPTQSYVLETLTNLVNVANNPMWQGVIESGMTSGMVFLKNVMGFDVYMSNYLPLCGADQSGTSETIDSVASGANVFFSMSADVVPFIGAWRQMPEVDGEYNKDFQREEYVMTARYGTKIYRPENLVTVLTSTDVV